MQWPLSWGQRALWFVERLVPGNRAYVIAGAGRVVGAELDRAAMQRALDRLVERHGALRSTFRESAGEIWQWEAEAGGCRLAAGAGTVGELAAEAYRPFDLERGPLFRAGVWHSEAGAIFWLALHHIVGDFASLGVLLRELGALYGEELGGPRAELGPAPSSGKWTERQLARLAGDEGRELEDYWRGRLEGMPRVLELPADRLRPAGQRLVGESLRWRLEAGLTGAVRRLGRREGATPAITLLAAFAVLLHRLTGQEQLLVGVPTTGRRSRESEGLVGYLVNPVPVASDLAGEPGFAEVLRRMRASALGAFDHQDYPLGLLAERLGVERDPSRSPLVQVAFVLQKGRRAGEDGMAALAVGESGVPLRWGALELASVGLEEPGAQFDLTVAATESPAGLLGRWQYDRELFDRATVARWAGQLESLLAAVVADPEVPIGDLALLQPAARHQLLAEWGRDLPSRTGGDAYARFRSQAGLRPDAVALVQETAQLSYGELALRAAGLAVGLTGRGAGPEAVVALWLPRSPELVTALLAVHHSGAAFLPLDPELPEARADLILADARPCAMVSGPGWAAESPLPSVPADPQSTAYLIYTSGSTGRPKGVAVSRGALGNLATRCFPSLGPEDVALGHLNVAFDASLLAIFPVLAAGGRVALLPAGAERDAAELARAFAEQQVTFFCSTPAAVRLWLSAPGEYPAVRIGAAGGEPLPAELVAGFHARCPGADFYNLYGPTEATVFALRQHCLPGTTEAPPLGRPEAGAEVFLLDGRFQPAPPGAPAEIVLGGAGLARGYRGLPERTAEAFRPHPWSDEPGARLYRTGDLGRYRPDGSVEFLGRRDQQVKLRGFRIELGEIEAALADLPGVEQALVLVRGERLIAYLEGAPGEDPAPVLSARLPDYMVPAAFVWLPGFPLLPSGKVDRKALPEPPRPGKERAERPRTAVEEILAGIWEEMLGLEGVGLQDDFFRLGGHSLLAARLLSRVREVFGAEIAVARLFAAPTLAALAGEIAQTCEDPLPPVLPGSPGDDAPLSFAQERLWFLHRLAPEDPAYNLAGGLEIRGPLDVAALEAGLAAIVRRHSPLRARIVEFGGRPVQRISQNGWKLPRIDLEAVRNNRELIRLQQAEARRGFRLATEPPLRCALLRLSASEHVLAINLHHIAGDGGSLDLFGRELAAGYRAYLDGEEARLPPLPVGYGDYARWQHSCFREKRLEAELGYWRTALAGAPTLLELPADRLRSRPASPRGATLRRELPQRERLIRLCREAGATPFMGLLAGFAALLSRLTGRDDLLIASPVAGRERPEVQNLIGFFVNTLALRLNLAAGADFRELLGRTRRTVLAALAHAELPFDRLIEALAPDREDSRTPLVQTMLAYLRTDGPAFALPGLAVELRPWETGAAKLDLTLSVEEHSAGLAGTWEYDRDLFDPATVARWAGHLETLLDAALAEPGKRVGELPLLNPAERRQLAEWNALEAPPGEALAARFARQAAAAPDALALVGEGVQLSYGELACRAGELAAELRRFGVAPGVLVGLSFERSVSLVLGLLAVVEAGGTYLPIDPAYPEERRTFLAADAGVAFTLSPQGIAGDRSAGRPVAEDLLYVIYTSGSTGRPKGAGVRQDGFANLLTWFMKAARLGPGERLLAISSPSFDLTQKLLFAPLVSGGVLHLGEAGPFDPGRIAARIEEEGITRIGCTPSAFYPLLETRGRRALASLGVAVLGGEPIARQRLAGCPAEVINSYGPTECTDVVAWHRLEAAEPEGSSVPLGRPLANTRLRVVDRHLQPLPVGVPGELAIAGLCVGSGYLGRPELTAERFRPDEWSEIPGSRLYRTGDLVRLRPDGRLLYEGRIDHQVKVRGFRVEPEEIEAVLREHPGVREAAVAASDERLVAFVVGEEAPVAELAAWAENRLPDYLVPSAWVHVDALPLSPNGKLNRRALVLPADREGNFEAPATATERALAAVWCELLGIERAGRQDHFFRLGGHSLLAVQLVARLRERLGIELPLAQLFAAPTLAGMAGRVRAAESDRPIPRLPRQAERVLSPAQERLWFLDRLDPGDPRYNMTGGLQLRGTLRPRLLAGALAAVIRRQEALRTTFGERNGRPFSQLTPAGPALPLVDLTALAAEPRERERVRRTGEEARFRFDLARGPLLRAVLFRLGPGDHLLALTLHHLVGDGWSLGLLAHEVAALYGGAALPELTVQYSDYAAWQQTEQQGEVIAAELASWTAALAGAPTRLELPTDRPRTPSGGGRGAVVPLSWVPGFPDELCGFAAREGTTPFALFLAGFAALLSRWTGQRDFLVGVPVAGRERSELENLVGFFVNTLALRCDLRGEPGFRELLGRIRERLAHALAHQQLPFARLVEALAPEREAGQSPLVQVLFAFQPSLLTTFQLPEVEAELVSWSNGTAKFDLTLAIEDGGGFPGSWELDRDLFDRATVARWSGYGTRLLAAVLAEPERPVSALPLLGTAEREQLLRQWNDAAGEGTVGLLHEPFWEQARHRPDDLALVAEDRFCSYGALARRAEAVAGSLRAAGVGPEVLVGVCAERSIDLVAALLAVLRAGGAYVPLDPGYPSDRLALTLADCRTPVLLTQAGLADRFPGFAGRVVLLDSEPEAAGAGGAFPVPAPDQLAYVIYTSGSTGRPKGVAISHRSAGALLAWSIDRYGARELSGVLASTSICFDMSVFELFVPLAVGGTAVLAESALELEKVARIWPVKLINTVPSAMGELVRRGAVPASVTTVNLGGEPLRRRLVEEIYERTAARRVVNLYGPSEDTTYSTAREISRGESGEPTLGRPLPGSRAYVVDAAGEPVPIGTPGELFLAGAGLARGYLGRPEWTADRFRPDGWSGLPGERAYRTGDLVRTRADGELVYLGRIDHQVKIRGFRVELEEIEAVLRRESGVRDAVVVAQGEGANRSLAAYVEGSGLSGAGLRSSLALRLPGYMVPAVLQILEALPRMPNGKVDRKLLPEVGLRDEAAAYAAPRTATEAALAEIWSEVLAISPVGVDDHFFRLGGHSLLAVQVASRIRERLGVDLPLPRLFESPTVAELALAVEAASRSVQPPIPRLARSGPLALSLAQERLWFLDRMGAGAVYNMPGAWYLRGALDAARLAGALAATVRRHETLRTTFAVPALEPVQVVGEAGFRLPSVDLSALLPERREAEIRRLAVDDARRPFDLAAGPLLRATLLREAASEHVLLLNLHHIVADGWSVGVLIRDLTAFYDSRPLPGLAVQYADYAAWQRAALDRGGLESQLEFWRQRLAGFPKLLELPTDRPRPRSQSFRGAVRPVHGGAELVAGLRRLGREEGATLFMLLLAGWQAFLGRLSGSDQLVVGSPIAGRPRLELEALVGFFVNLLALPADLHGGLSFRELVRRTRATALDAFAHPDLPFEKLVEALHPVRDPASSPLFQVLFVLQQNDPLEGVELPGLTIERLPAGGRVARFDLTLALTEGESGLQGGLEHSTDLFDGVTVERWWRQTVRLLAAAVAEPDRGWKELPLLDRSESHQILVEWSVHPADADPRGFADSWSEQHRRRPDAVALVLGDACLTCGALEASVARQAEHLQRLGVGPEIQVALFLGRSFAAVSIVLAVLRTGGAYLPIELGLPPERLAFLLDDARPLLLVTQRSERGRLPILSIPVIDAEELGAATGGARPMPEVADSCLAYVIYTSGSSGAPKGVGIARRSLDNLTRQHGADFTESDLVLAKASLSFDVSLLAVFVPLVLGARIVLVPAGAEQDLTETVRLSLIHQVTILGFPPSAFLGFLAQEASRGCTSVRRWSSGAEAIPPGLPERLFAQFPAAELVNIYGPTEGTVLDLSWRCRREDRGRPIPIGRPYAGGEAYLLDRSLAPVPIGAPGELCLGGICLARGYLGRPGLTAEKFVPHPYGGSGQRLYRTGDLVRQRCDGAVEFLGRLDQQVKIRGFRIELAEIESALESHPGVRVAAVVVREGEAGGRLAAYFQARSPVPAETELREFLGRRLPVYMVPSFLVPLAQLPLLISGKVDRAALVRLRPQAGSGPEERPVQAPQTPLEEAIAEIWTEVLDLDRSRPLSVHDGFFDLGGHSLLAMQALLRLKAAFGVELSVRVLFEAPTIAGIANALAEQLTAGLDQETFAELLAQLD